MIDAFDKDGSMYLIRMDILVSVRDTLALSQTSSCFYIVCKSFENFVGKGEIAHNGQLLLFAQHFLSFWRTCHFFLQILNCRLQTLSVKKSRKSVIWERVKLTLYQVTKLTPSALEHLT